MPSIDSIGDGHKKNRFKKSKEISKKISPTKNSLPQKSSEIKKKKKLMWLIITIIITFIIIGWLFLLKEGLIFSDSESKGWNVIKDGFNKILNIFKKSPDAKNDNINIPTTEEQIRELEKRVFPQFENINK